MPIAIKPEPADPKTAKYPDRSFEHEAVRCHPPALSNFSDKRKF